MTETQDLIAAALMLADEFDSDLERPTPQAAEVRELCARAMVQPVGEVPMPEPAYLNAGFEGWGSPLRSAYSEDDMRTYGEQCRAAGYAAGVAAEVPMQCGWYQDGDEESTTWQTSCGRYFTLNDGTPTDNGFEHCYSCGKHLVEYPIEEDAALRGEVKS